MGLVIKAALGALVVLLIGVLAKTKNYYIAGLIPLFPTFCAYRALYCCQRTRHEALRATIIFSMWSIIPYFGLPGVAVVFHRNDALARRFCWFCCVLGDKRMGVDYMLDKAALTQMTTAIKWETASGDKATGK
ncbi:GlpM family protein [Escherichia coli]|nr:GlpM family protein [Escherichia coli]